MLAFSLPGFIMLLGHLWPDHWTLCTAVAGPSPSLALPLAWHRVRISVLPVRHKFVRGFGLGRSVLIVDEVHAYDSYMYGLLTAVLRAQKNAGGCAVLLSATLPKHQRQQIAAAWQDEF